MKSIVKLTILTILSFRTIIPAEAQTLSPDLQNTALWTTVNRSIEAFSEDGKKAVRINEVPDDGLMILKNAEFSNGTLEFDVKGKNVVQQSFVGIAFHLQNNTTFDAVYFRPFNFVNPDTIRRWRAVQYISSPNYPWEKLRESFPGKYESKVNPVPDPDNWFHAKVVVKGKQVSVYVNHSSTPSLSVEKLTNTSRGGVALWVGNNSGASFANLKIKNQ
jgi:hypothetical protein